MHWYTVSTKPHQGKQAESHISQCGIEFFSPLLKESKIIRRIRKTGIEPPCPGYLFAQFELERHYRAVSYAAGVHEVVEFGSGPVELDATVIDAIKERLDDGYVPLIPVRPNAWIGRAHQGWSACGVGNRIRAGNEGTRPGALAAEYTGTSCQADPGQGPSEPASGVVKR